MSLGQQVANTTLPFIVYDQKYTNFVDVLLKESADEFEREGKCMYPVMCSIYHFTFFTLGNFLAN